MNQFLAVTLFCFSATGWAIPDISCIATLMNGDSGEIKRGKLFVSEEDPNFFVASIDDYSFGADNSFLPEEGVGLIVMNNKSKIFASGLTGFRRIGGTKHREAALQLYDRSPLGELIIGTVRCGYIEP